MPGIILVDNGSVKSAAMQQRLDRGEVPDLGDIQRMSKPGQKIYKVPDKNGLSECSANLIRPGRITMQIKPVTEIRV